VQSEKSKSANGKSQKVQIEKEKKLKKTLNQRTFLIFYWVWMEIYFYWVEKKLKRFFGGKTGKTEPQV
jgi:hypothetical protein